MEQEIEYTKRLFDQDSFLTSCESKVLSCEWDEKKKAFAIVLDQTVFFPEEGGQYADSGLLDGISVIDVKERNHIIYHYTKEAIAVHTSVHAQIYWQERFEKMQQHTGEHIVSGLIHQIYGLENVGFHLGPELVTMDFNGILTNEQVEEIEWRANEAIVKNIDVIVQYPDTEELSKIAYRSKKELEGQIRIVSIPEYDICACCAPHVKQTGQIGMLRLIDMIHYKGGIRINMVCGFRALRDYRRHEANAKTISHLLSCKIQDTAQATERLYKEAGTQKEQIGRLQTQYLNQKLDAVSAEETLYLLFEADAEKNAARRFVDEGKKRCKGIFGIFIGSETKGWQCILGSETINLREAAGPFFKTFSGKGGGQPQMIQGTVYGTQDEICAFFQTWKEN